MNVKQLLNKKYLSTADKDSIIAEAELLGLDTNINHGCSDCYRDLLVQIGVKQNEKSDNEVQQPAYRDWETDRKSTRLNSSHSAKSRMPSSA